MERYIIIVAGGKGLRMGGDVPKQFIPLGGKPILMRTMEAFASYDKNIHIILIISILCCFYVVHSIFNIKNIIIC